MPERERERERKREKTKLKERETCKQKMNSLAPPTAEGRGPRLLPPLLFSLFFLSLTRFLVPLYLHAHSRNERSKQMREQKKAIDVGS